MDTLNEQKMRKYLHDNMEFLYGRDWKSFNGLFNPNNLNTSDLIDQLDHNSLEKAYKFVSDVLKKRTL